MRSNKGDIIGGLRLFDRNVLLRGKFQFIFEAYFCSTRPLSSMLCADFVLNNTEVAQLALALKGSLQSRAAIAGATTKQIQPHILAVSPTSQLRIVTDDCSPKA